LFLCVTTLACHVHCDNLAMSINLLT